MSYPEEYYDPDDPYFTFKEEWPEFFSNVYCGCFIPTCWEDLVWSLCEVIETRLRWAEKPLDSLKVAQVKEKFGGLRFYYDLEEDVPDDTRHAIQGAVAVAEAMSFKIKGAE